MGNCNRITCNDKEEQERQRAIAEQRLNQKKQDFIIHNDQSILYIIYENIPIIPLLK